MDRVLSASPGERITVNFESLDGTDMERDVPETFRRFYRGELDDFVESPKNSKQDKQKRHTLSFRLDLAYRGTDFCGWQTQDQEQSNQPLLPAVQDVVQAALQDRNVRVAGRTDSGVHAVGQVARIRCEATMTADDLQKQLQEASARSGSWACRRVMPVSHSFHPTFGATCRSYIYLVDANTHLERTFGDITRLTLRLNALLAPLEGQSLAYIAFSYGRLKTKTSDCTLHHARARNLKIDNQPVLAIELSGDRFLRRMVRILVASLFRLAAKEISNEKFDPQSLRKLVQTKDRRQAAPAAPPEGLIFVSAAFDSPNESL